MGPEFLDGVCDRQTMYSDPYVLWMEIYGVLSGRVPFDQRVDLVVVGRVVKGGRPRGREWMRFTDDAWKVLERCW